MKNSGRLILVITTITASSIAFAAENACVIERMGLKDCYQTTGLDETQFKTLCTSVNQPLVPDAPPAKITFQDSCPTPVQGICENFYSQPLDAYYYGREAEILKHTKNGCEDKGGTWKTSK